MPTTFANTIDGNDIYAARAVADKDGNQIDTTYAKSASLSTVATTGDYDDLSNKPTIPAAQVNSDWNAASGVAEILNKPSDLVQDANYVHTDENFTSAEKTKLSGIATGAEVNVQADWNESNSSSDAYIQNKPTIPAAQVNADWNASSGVAEILNKPTILPYKPVVAGTGVRIVDDTQNNRIVVEADETVLWTGDSGAIIDSTNGSVLLSETAMNFEKIRIYAQGSALNSGGATIDVTIGSTSPLSFIPVSLTYTNDGSTMFTDCCVVQFDGTSFKYKLGFRISVSATPDLSRQSNRGLKIVKVVGVNRIASN